MPVLLFDVQMLASRRARKGPRCFDLPLDIPVYIHDFETRQALYILDLSASPACSSIHQSSPLSWITTHLLLDWIIFLRPLPYSYPADLV